MKRYLTTLKILFIKYLPKKEEGATLAEYGLLLALMAVVCIAGISALGSRLSALFSSFADSM